MHDSAEGKMDLNNPEIRLSILRRRLADGAPLVASALADEFAISVDTVRRDLIALERLGAAQRVRGGAVPMGAPAVALRERLEAPVPSALVACALARLEGAATLLLDGGTTVLALARALRPAPGLVVMTPSPFVAAATHQSGIETITLPGRISAPGGIAVGAPCEAMLAEVAADVAVLGACGLDAAFGLSSDDLEESVAKRAMARAARLALVLTGGEKLGRRARHRTLAPSELDVLVTDASPETTAPFAAQGLEISLA